MLDGQLAAIFGRAFAGLYLPATLHKRAISYDSEGNPTASATDYTCRAQLDAATEAMRQAAGYTDTDVAIYVLAYGLAVTIDSDDEITVKGQRYTVASVERDPAAAYFLCRGQLA